MGGAVDYFPNISAWAIGLASFLANLLALAFAHGKMDQRVATLEAQRTELREELNARLDKIDVLVGKIYDELLRRSH
jgi:parvulin-like peptidyl-prolyl isomerase